MIITFFWEQDSQALFVTNSASSHVHCGKQVPLSFPIDVALLIGSQFCFRMVPDKVQPPHTFGFLRFFNVKYSSFNTHLVGPECVKVVLEWSLFSESVFHMFF